MTATLQLHLPIRQLSALRIASEGTVRSIVFEQAYAPAGILAHGSQAEVVWPCP